ncbi:MAG TPA: methyltransferase domain-containing protein [Candidatus Saccharimonadales bacterium]|nr:methyltransferase domain-containing protein [Candidatus Saccharimonadales bacterium]
MFTTSHEIANQENYKKSADLHNKFCLDSTLYLAYRDIPALLEKHLFKQNNKESYRILDFGCGAGLSTEIISKIILSSGYKVDIVGVDLSEENLKFARERIPHAEFVKTNPNQCLKRLGDFDLIVCNFVLVENQHGNMVNILKAIQPLLKDTGILITTNCTSKVYQRSMKWRSFNNDFVENTPHQTKDGKLKFEEDQPVKLQILTGKDSFTFFDFFHSERDYKSAYEIAELKLSETHKPLGLETDNMPWQSESKYSPYKIHVLTKQPIQKLLTHVL